jgi:photosystem II stability/assembly factor-like uncharacterized protein
MRKFILCLALACVIASLASCGPMAVEYPGIWTKVAVYKGDGLGWAIGRAFTGPDLQNESGVILRTTNGGARWSKQTGDLPPFPASASFPDARHGWVVGNDSAIVATTDGGIHWSTQEPPGPVTLWGVSFADTSHGWAVGSTLDSAGNGTIIATSDGGAHWSTQWTAPGLSPFAIASTDDAHAWTLASDDSNQGSAIMGTSDGGWNWAVLARSDTKLYAISFSDSLHGWVGGNAGSVLATSDGGKTWVHRDVPEAQAAEAVVGLSFVDQRHGWAITDRGPYHSIMATDDAGAHWVVRKSDQLNSGRPSGSSYVSVSFADAQHGWVATPGFILATDDGGLTWKTERFR